MRDANSGLASALRGPVIMITIGILFLLDKFTSFQFGQTWPVILIVLGALALGGGWKNNVSQTADMPPGTRPGMPLDPPPPPPGVRR